MQEERKVLGSFDGIDGNAFMLMGYFQQQAKRQRFSKEWIERVLDEAEIINILLISALRTSLSSSRSKDYNHLVVTLLAHMEEVDE